MDHSHPVVVYSLADVPPLLRSTIRPDSPLFRCCFYAAIGAPTISAGISQAFDRVPEPPCDEVDEGMRVARAVEQALRQTTVAILIFATRSAEEMTKYVFGFHAGEAAPFRTALEAAGLTLVEGADVFREWLRFLVSDTAIVVRKIHEHTLDFALAHVVTAPQEPGAPALFAIMAPPREWQCTLVGMDGGVVDLSDVPPNDTRPLRFEPQRSTSAVAEDDSPEMSDLAELSPHRVSALLAGNDPAGAVGEALMRATVEHATKLAPDRLRVAARVWVRFLMSSHVTGRMGRFGDALLTGLSLLVGDACIREIVVDEGRSLRGEGPRPPYEAWIETTVALVMAHPSIDAERSDPVDMAAQLREALDGMVERLRNLGMPLDRARFVLDARWAAPHLDGALRRFGFEKHGDTYQHASGLKVTTFVDAPRGRAYLEASGGEHGLAAGFISCVSPACDHHNPDTLVQRARAATSDEDIALLLWQLGAAGRHPSRDAFVQRWLSRWEDEAGIVGEAAREARALYESC